MSSSSKIAETWISQFCSLLGHEYFAEVSEDFIEDDFNLTGLPAQVPMYKEALELILDVEPEEDEEEEPESEEISEDDEVLGDDGRSYRRNTRHMRMASDASVIESSAELLYGLIHQRYITSRPGIQQMLEKYELRHFGHCPRVTCYGARVLPVGLSDTPGQDTVKLYCPSCVDIYTPPNSRFQTVDGAFFGTTFGCLFFMTFPELEVGVPRPEHATTLGASTDTPRAASASSHTRAASKSLADEQPTTINGMASSNMAPGLGEGNVYEPRIYGFRVSERARTGPRMKWLREKPSDIEELDEAARFEDGLQVDAGDQMDGEDAEGSALSASAAGTANTRTNGRRRSSKLRPNGNPAPTGGNPMEVENDAG